MLFHGLPSPVGLRRLPGGLEAGARRTVGTLSRITQSIATSIEWESPQREAFLHLSCAVLLMTTIASPLSEERVAQLRLRAAEVGLPPEEFLRRRVEQLLDHPDEQFQKASEYLLEKNAELYRRLA